MQPQNNSRCCSWKVSSDGKHSGLNMTAKQKTQQRAWEEALGTSPDAQTERQRWKLGDKKIRVLED